MRLFILENREVRGADRSIIRCFFPENVLVASTGYADVAKVVKPVH